MRSPLKAMSRLALSRGQGSTIWVTRLVITASPASSEMASLRRMYSEQPPSSAMRPTEATARRIVPALVCMDLLKLGMRILLRQVEHMAGKRQVGRRSNARGGGREPARLGARDFGLAEQEEVTVVRRQAIVSRRLDQIARARRLDQMRRHDDGEIGLVLLIGLGREQRAQNRHAAEPWQLFDLVLRVGLQQT